MKKEWDSNRYLKKHNRMSKGCLRRPPQMRMKRNRRVKVIMVVVVF